MQATRTVHESTLASIYRLVAEAQQSKPEIERLGDRLASYFVPSLIVLSVITFVVWFYLAKSGWIATEHTPWTLAIMFAITVLVISCPCALALASPTATMVGSGVAGRLGILFKTGAAIEAAARVTTVVFDKTGTLTQGSLTVPPVSTERSAADLLTGILSPVRSDSSTLVWPETMTPSTGIFSPSFTRR